MRLPIRVRLTAWYALLLAFLLAAVGAFVAARLRSDLEREIDRSLISAAPQIARGYEAEGSKDFFDVASTIFPAGAAAVQILDPQRRPAVAYGGPTATRPMVSRELLAAALRGRRRIETVSLRGEQFRVLALRVDRLGKPRALVLAESLRDRDRSVSRLLVLLGIAFPVALVVAVAGGWLLARRALRPVEQMTSRADRIGIDRVEERIPVPAASDEIAHLAVTLNAMLDRLRRGVDEKRQLVAHTSHELRTPLAAMQSELDVSLRYEQLEPPARRLLESVREEVGRMSALVTDLLTLAMIDERRLELREEVIDLGEILREVDHKLAPLASGIDLQVDLPDDPVMAVGDVERMCEVASNLIVNALRFAGPGARVRVATWQEGAESGFLVSDTGPGIRREARAHVFDRFWRAEESRARDSGGSGLGLAICREIVEAHGGRIWVDSEEGRGACFWVALPAGPAAPAPALT